MESKFTIQFCSKRLALPVILAFALLMTSLAGPTLTQAQTPAQAIVLPAPWTRDWNAARQYAARENLPVLMMFSADWSPPCEEVLTKLLTVNDVQNQLASNWVPVFVDETQDPELHERYKIRALPTFVVFNLLGEEHTRFVGSREPADFLGQLQNAYETMIELAQIREALNKDPRNPYIYKALGDLLLNLGRFDHAEDAYNSARKYDPDDRTEARADLMFLDAMKTANQDPAKGMDLFNKLASTYPSNPRVGDAIYVSAMIELEQFKDFQRARTLLERYIKQYPDGRFAEIAEEQLKTMNNRR